MWGQHSNISYCICVFIIQLISISHCVVTYGIILCKFTPCILLLYISELLSFCISLAMVSAGSTTLVVMGDNPGDKYALARTQVTVRESKTPRERRYGSTQRAHDVAQTSMRRDTWCCTDADATLFVLSTSLRRAIDVMCLLGISLNTGTQGFICSKLKTSLVSVFEICQCFC